ncbi:MAG: hypothetical protein K2N85_06055 [Lachnospiraceae bacterium]|nr:hypothetical protein [Lachnospiraceae bacterium]
MFAEKIGRGSNRLWKRIKSVLFVGTGKIKSGNPVTDVILLELKNEAEKRNIDFQSDFHYPAGTNINAFDVSVMLMME